MIHSEKIDKPKGVIQLLARTFELYYKNFGLYFGYAAWLFIPLVATVLAYISFNQEVVEMTDILFNVILYTLIVVWLEVIFILTTPLLESGKTIKTREISVAAWTLLIPYILITLLLLLISAGGFLLLVIPGLILTTWFAFASIITILEKAHVTAALKRSKQLVKGRFLQVFWRIFGGIAAIFFLLFIAIFIAVSIDAGVNGIDPTNYTSAPPSLLLAVLARLIEIFFLPIVIIYPVLLYLELKKTAPSAKVNVS